MRWCFTLGITTTSDTASFRNTKATDAASEGRLLQRLAQALERTYSTCVLPNTEADDALGVMYQDGDLLYSLDKDLRTIAGSHLLPNGEVMIVPELEANRAFYKQVLVGDSTDGYGGCPASEQCTSALLLRNGSHATQSMSSGCLCRSAMHSTPPRSKRNTATQTRCGYQCRWHAAHGSSDPVSTTSRTRCLFYGMGRARKQSATEP